MVCLFLACCAGGEYGGTVWSLEPSWGIAIIVVAGYAVGGIFGLPTLREHDQLSALSAV